MENPSTELSSPDAFAAMMKDVLGDAVTRFAEKAQGPVEFASLGVYSFKQTWPDASCGFGGIAAQVLTDAQTVVVSWTEGNSAAVYIRGAFAYLADAPNQAFWDAVAAHRLPGASEPHEYLSR